MQLDQWAAALSGLVLSASVDRPVSAHDLEGVSTGWFHHFGPYVIMGVVLLGLLVAGYRLATTTHCEACQGVVRRDAAVCIHCREPLQ